MLSLRDSEKTINLSNEISLHCNRVRTLANALCEELNIDNKESRKILISAELHDIGKSVVNQNIINKPGTLNENEWDQIKKHSKFGYIMAKNMGYPESLCKNILYHHENIDGTGYYNVKNENIPLGALIIRVCDSYDAIRSKRIYKGNRSHTEAINEMIKNEKNYNKSILEKFLGLDFSRIDYG